MKSKQTPIEFPKLALNACSVDEYCKALNRIGSLSYWWYQGVSRIFGNYSLPFKDKNGNWWYQIKPGLCWPVDIFKSIESDKACPKLTKSYLGYQYIVTNNSDANSKLTINTIFDLKNYDPFNLKSKRRNKIRQGFKRCDLEILDCYNKRIFDECRLVWNSLSKRTNWKQPAKAKTFDSEWQMLLDCPGVSIILAREKKSDRIAGFMIVKIIGDTAYSDTIAVRTDMLPTRANDALRYAFLINSKRLDNVTKGYSAIKSSLKGLELFKSELGYTPYPFHAVTKLNIGVKIVLKTFFTDKYKRMTAM